MAYIRRSNGGLMEVDNPNDYKKKAVWDNSDERNLLVYSPYILY